jgi:uncharacterized protein YbbC (DUF1343 family)
MRLLLRSFGVVALLLSFAFGGAITPAAERPELYLPLLKGKRVALVVNHTSLVGKEPLVDFLLRNGIAVQKIFAPEHGVQGRADAGDYQASGYDARIGLNVISLYGKKSKPSKADLVGVDLILFDIQDVGVRFYTYLSTLHFVMEAAAREQIPLLVLDRPNPNGGYIDGPMLDPKYSSFVGLDPVPVVYGMTIGEYALMLNSEGWLGGSAKVLLTVIPMRDYAHHLSYAPPIKPSPNLPNERAIALYPSLAFFEGTVISEGRGTKSPFQLYGAPKYDIKKFSFIPKSLPGASDPKFEGKRCFGVDLRSLNIDDIHAKKEINLSYLLDAYRNYGDKPEFFLKNGFFDRLAGSDRLRKQILSGASEQQIRESWQNDIERFKKIRQKYLLYP